MKASTPIAVTGYAWTTPMGDDLDAVWARMLAGETGIAPVVATAKLRNDLGAPVSTLPFDGTGAERMTALALPALRRALAQADCNPADDDVLFVLGTSLGAFLEGEPGSAPLNEWADVIGRAVNASRPPISLSTACSSGTDAILVAAEMIRAGVAKRCVCGGVDVLTMSKRLAHSALGSLSPTTLRAFDLRHDGTLLGEGAGFLVLEAVDTHHDTHRDTQRPKLALLRGVGSANDAAGMTAPDAAGLGARYAMERSLADAGLSPSDIGVVNAHGSGTPLNDATEAIAFKSVFGAHKPIVWGTKGNFGHSLGATGLLEAITILLALRTGKVPPVWGLEQVDPRFDVPIPHGAPMATDARFGLSVTLGFGGFDTSVIFEKGAT